MEGREFEDIHLATIHGSVSQLRVLLKSGLIDVNARDKEGTTALILGAVNNQVECVKELLRFGANPELTRITGTTALFFACQSGFAEISRLLLNARVSANPKTLHDGATPLHAAAQNGHIDCVNCLLQHRRENLISRSECAGKLGLIVDIDAQLTDGATPLFLAAQNNQLAVIRALIEAGVDVNRARRDLATPVYIAAQLGQARAVRVLLRAGAEVDAPREDGATALFKAAQKGHLGVVQTLLAHGASVGLAGNGETALHAAVLFGRTRISHLLLLRGADPRLRNKDGVSALQIAQEASFRDLECVLRHFAPEDSRLPLLRNTRNMRVTAPIHVDQLKPKHRSWTGGALPYRSANTVPVQPCVNSMETRGSAPGEDRSTEDEREKPTESLEGEEPDNFVELLSTEARDIPANNNDVAVQMSAVKCANLADDRAAALLLAAETIPQSAPSVVRRAPWRHAQYDSFMPPSPPRSRSRSPQNRPTQLPSTNTDRPALRRQASDAAVTYGPQGELFSPGPEEANDDGALLTLSALQLDRGGGRGGVRRLVRSRSTAVSQATDADEGATDAFGQRRAAPRVRLVGLSARQQLPGALPSRMPSFKTYHRLRRVRKQPVAVNVSSSASLSIAPGNPSDEPTE